MPTTPTSPLARVSRRSRREESAEPRVQDGVHVSVLLDEVVTALAVGPEDVVVDATAGQGGHSAALLAQHPKRLLALDADPVSVDLVSKRFAGEKNVSVIQANFSTLEAVLHAQHVPQASKVLFDLGWNSGQLMLGRGFSFQQDEPLLMSYGDKPASGFSAQEILADWNEETIANVLFGYGEEHYSRRIAKAIVERRKIQPLTSTIELAELVKDAVPAAYRHGRLHPATKTFQALRIAVNDEFGVIEKGVGAAWAHLSEGGRIAVITFHSIEDRLVKQLFQQYVREGGQLMYKKPLVPSREEIIRNPRARSAKLRVIEKVCTTNR